MPGGERGEQHRLDRGEQQDARLVPQPEGGQHPGHQQPDDQRGERRHPAADPSADPHRDPAVPAVAAKLATVPRLAIAVDDRRGEGGEAEHEHGEEGRPGAEQQVGGAHDGQPDVTGRPEDPQPAARQRGAVHAQVHHGQQRRDDRRHDRQLPHAVCAGAAQSCDECAAQHRRCQAWLRARHVQADGRRDRHVNDQLGEHAAADQAPLHHGGRAPGLRAHGPRGRTPQRLPPRQARSPRRVPRRRSAIPPRSSRSPPRSGTGCSGESRESAADWRALRWPFMPALGFIDTEPLSQRSRAAVNPFGFGARRTG